IVSAILLYWNSSWIAHRIFNNPGLTPSFHIAAFAIPAYAMINIHAGVLQGLKKLKKYLFIRFISHHALGLLLFLMIFWFRNIDSIVIFSYTMALYLIMGMSVYWVRVEKKQRDYTDSSDPDPAVSKTLLRRSLPFMIAALLFYLKGWVDTIMIGIFLEETQVGIYNIALKLSALLGITVSAVSAVAAPGFSKTFSSGDMIKLRKNVQYSSSIIFFTTLLPFLLLVLFPEIILSLFGTEFSGAGTVLIILAVGSFINAFFGMAGYLMNMTGNQIPLQYFTLVAVITGILLNLWLIPTLGTEGAALATMITIIAWNLMCVIFLIKKYGIHSYYNPFRKM
ncbi:MAG: oligosaccharide flippase family protein, partial [Bacteroidetes bacterium]|nr:oligosaccharide flippase family protein [Bacteroidota bacterium]